MSWGRGPPYRYHWAEWLGVFLVLLATPAFVYGPLFDAAHMSVSLLISVELLFGALAASGWTLLILGRRAHLRAEGTDPA